MRIVSAALSFILVFSIFTACQREKSFEVGAPATGSLKRSTNWECLPKNVAGAYIAGAALTDSNYLEVDVDVATEGAYLIRTDTVKGFSFSGLGNFSKTGTNRIRLAATGTPTEAGQHEFTVFFDTSICSIPVTVLPTGSTNGPAVFTLQGVGDSCIVATVSGSYVQNAPLDGTNTIALKVNVTTPGTYSVTTNTMNGFYFSGTSTLGAPGEQTIVLNASGTPLTEERTVFTISAGTNTTCSFGVTVTASDTPPVNSAELFPLKKDNWWSYLPDVTAPQDSFAVYDMGPEDFAGNTYHLLQSRDAGQQPFDSAYIRKEGTEYYRFIMIDSSSVPGLEETISGDVFFLRDNLDAGDSWTNDVGITVGGVPAEILIVYTCTAANTTATVNGKSFTGVYKVSGKLQLAMGGVTTDVATEEAYYAKGIGLIYLKGSGSGGEYEQHIKNHKVN